MSGSVTIWVLSAVVLFWGVGAYNRLVRLRSLAVEAFTALDAQFGHYVTLIQDSFSGASSDAAPPAQAGLMGAALQFESSMKVARDQPLDVQVMRALETAHGTLCASWLRLRNEPPDLAGAPLPEALHQQWEHISLRVDAARVEFNRRVHDYNSATRQFPARMLAWLIGFKLAHQIRDGG
jgi:LemA protein